MSPLLHEFKSTQTLLPCCRPLGLFSEGRPRTSDSMVVSGGAQEADLTPLNLHQLETQVCLKFMVNFRSVTGLSGPPEELHGSTSVVVLGFISSRAGPPHDLVCHSLLTTVISVSWRDENMTKSCPRLWNVSEIQPRRQQLHN